MNVRFGEHQSILEQYGFPTMKIYGQDYHTIWEKAGTQELVLCYINQNKLPHQLDIVETNDYKILLNSIKNMDLRGAPLIGIAGAYTLCLALKIFKDREELLRNIDEIAQIISDARPTAVNLAWAIKFVLSQVNLDDSLQKIQADALAAARKICSDELIRCKQIGKFGKQIIKEIADRKNGSAVNILTHCNAGWLATLDYGTALAPIYAARDAGIKLHIWVDETRPRNQGSKLTAFELVNENIPHTIIADNTGGHLMQEKMVDIVIVGADRATITGDVANKIGTYLKALAAKDNDIPFFVALPSSSFDFTISSGLEEIQIEERDSDEVLFADGIESNRLYKVRIAPIGSKALNYGFDITPARLITALITERGVIPATEDAIRQTFLD